MALAVATTYMFSQIPDLILRIGVHGLGSFCPGSTNVHALSQFLLHIFLLSPFDIA
jgi:hypothetical protein